MSRATLRRELCLVVPGTAVLAVDDLMRHHGLSATETEIELRAAGHSFVLQGPVDHIGEDDPTIELEPAIVARALRQHDPSWVDEDTGTWTYDRASGRWELVRRSR